MPSVTAMRRLGADCSVRGSSKNSWVRIYRHSTPGSDIQFRRQMRSRLGEPTTVAALRLLLHAGLLLRLVLGASGVLRRDYPFESYPAVDGVSDRAPDNHDAANAML